jgi:TonB family protein
MTELIKYQLIVTVCTAVFYSFYKLFLNNETFFNINRFLILIFISISFLIPLIKIETTNPVIIQSTQNINNFIVFETNNKITPVPDIKPNIHTEQLAVSAASSWSFNYIDIIIILYFSGIVFSLVKLLKAFAVIYKLKKKSDYNFLNGAKYYLVRENLGSFSFFNTIFISESAFSKHEANSILSHERVHVNDFHSLDMIFLALVKAVQWFNPFIYMIEKELKTVHEYIADSNVIKIEKNQDLYIDVLLNQSIGAQLSDLTNNFNSTTIIRRLKMITKTKSSKSRLWRYSLFILPLTISIILFSCKEQKVNKYGFEIEPLTPSGITKCDVFAQPEIGWKKLNELVKSEQKTPFEAKKNNITCEVWVGFEVDTNGYMSNFKYQNGKIAGKTWLQDGIGYGIDDEVFRVMKVISEKVKWKPAILKNKKIAQHLSQPFSFGDPEVWKTYHVSPKVTYSAGGSNCQFEITNPCSRASESLPSFFTEDSYQQIYYNIKYPEEALINKIGGEVIISFAISNNGDVINPKIDNPIGNGLDEAALKAFGNVHGLKVNGFDHKGKTYSLKIRFIANTMETISKI